MAIGVAYKSEGSVIELLLSVISHVSVLHLGKNLATIILCFGILYKWSSLRWFGLLSLSVPVNYTYGEVVGPVMGLSGGTFAVLGAATLVAFDRFPRTTVLCLSIIAVYQATVTTPEVAIAHSIAFLIGAVMLQISQLETSIHYHGRISRT